MTEETWRQKIWEKRRWGEREIGKGRTIPTIFRVIDCKKRKIKNLCSFSRFIGREPKSIKLNDKRRTLKLKQIICSLYIP
jgi:hypothetical protein